MSDKKITATIVEEQPSRLPASGTLCERYKQAHSCQPVVVERGAFAADGALSTQVLAAIATEIAAGRHVVVDLPDHVRQLPMLFTRFAHDVDAAVNEKYDGKHMRGQILFAGAASAANLTATLVPQKPSSRHRR